MFIKYIILFLICDIGADNIDIANKTKKIVCYHGSWSSSRKSFGKFDVAENMDPLLCTHLIYAFCGIKSNGELEMRNVHFELGGNIGRGYIHKFNDLKIKNPALKTLLSVGGWNEGSKNFSIVAADPLKRHTFINFTINFLRKHNFSGLDIDWEYPNQRHNLENDDRENFIIWLRELKERFKPYGFVLTAAVKGVGYSAEKSYNISEMVKYLDFLNVMSYALNGVWNPVIGMNAPLYPATSDLTERAKQRNFDAIVKFWIQQGAPRGKIVMGVPFYGRSYTLQNSNNYLIGSNHSGVGIAGPYTKQSGILGYNELCEKFLWEKSLWHLEWEANQMVPYAHRDLQWISYDNERSIAMKVDYVNKENLGGIIIWTVDLDDFRGLCGSTRYPLLAIIRQGLLEKSNVAISTSCIETAA